MAEYLKINRKCSLTIGYYDNLLSMVEKGIFYNGEINDSAVEILLLCDGTRTREEIYNEIKHKNKFENDKFKEGILYFIDQFIRQNIIEVKFKKNKGDIVVYGNKEVVIPYYISMEITNKCQLKCKHCFNDSGEAKSDELSTEHFIDIANTLSELGVKHIFLTGGEPLLKENVSSLITFCAEHFVSVTIGTNGYTLPEEILATIAKYKNIRLQISVDGLEEQHNTIRGVSDAFYKTLENIKRYISFGKSVIIAFTISENNFSDLEPLIILCKNLGCKGFNIGITGDIGRAKRNGIQVNFEGSFLNLVGDLQIKYNSDRFYIGFETCQEKIEEKLSNIKLNNKCGAGYKVMHIRSNGVVTPCPTNMSLIVGNLKVQKFSDLIKINNLKRFVELPTPTKEVCLNCFNYESCGSCLTKMLEKNNKECHLKRRLNGYEVEQTF